MASNSWTTRSWTFREACHITTHDADCRHGTENRHSSLGAHPRGRVLGFGGGESDLIIAAFCYGDVPLGEEYYGSVGIDIPEDGTAREIMEVGEIAYWPPGRALCIFFGRTPASTDARPRAASPVMPIGRVIAGLGSLPPLGKHVKMKFQAV